MSKSHSSFFKQFPSNFTHNLLLIWPKAGERQLLDPAGSSILSSDNPFDFHVATLLPLVTV